MELTALQVITKLAIIFSIPILNGIAFFLAEDAGHLTKKVKTCGRGSSAGSN